MKLVLIGHSGSQFLVPASMYLVQKYMPMVELIGLNYQGNINDWSKYVADYLKTLEDEYIIFALDDYLLNNYLENGDFRYLFVAHEGFDNLKLCQCTPEEQEAYPVTTQYTIWKRKVLINILEHTTTPWDFEVKGSKIFKEKGYMADQVPLLNYDVHSGLSKRWEGVRLNGLNEEDIKIVQSLI